ncbi:hypothetical protein GCM10010495_65980 [Kitasatospora herbaricolor]|uniref:hypothetical protein n=1 Tax=Kitasatospora herbaricolor TaxID=68217 RepID=UPI00174E80D0|nr:hypothetical protein [Kitasatospora herbaricolor]MDQ0307953.1 hypothetical protein [Kitasatospora herbaricolor]GGV39451.1 hypothetical protein GCM10010495_65980 [Kitasatospora herbaricolor]
MLYDSIASRLRALRRKGSGQRFEQSDAAAWVQLGLQRPRFNSADSPAFTVDVSVIDHRAEAYRADWLQDRINQTASSVVAAVTDSVMPGIRRHLDKT